MRIYYIAGLPVAAALTLGFAFAASPVAEASPRFTVGNKTDKSLSVEIYNGDDSVCMQSSKTSSWRLRKLTRMAATAMAKAVARLRSSKVKADLQRPREHVQYRHQNAG